MAKIKKEEIVEILKEDGWTLKSEEYVNLDEPLEFTCAAGHTVYAPWKKIRKERFCPICAANHSKITSIKALPKTSEKRVLALDQATHITGFSIYDGPRLVHYGVFESEIEDEIARDHALKEWLISMCYNWKPDFIAFEDIQMQQINGRQVHSADNVVGILTFKVLAHLQGILMDTAYELNIPYFLCPTPTWRSFCKVKGKTKADKKKSMQHIVNEEFGVSATNDEADAIGIGKYAAAQVQLKYTITSWE